MNTKHVIQKKLNVACIAGLSDSNLTNHLLPIILNPLVESLHLIRAELPPDLAGEKVIFHEVSTKSVIVRLVKAYFLARKINRMHSVDLWVSFNPFPHALLALFSGGLKSRAKFHFGFIGSDWAQFKTRSAFRLFRPFVQKADILTAPGETMRQDMIAHGLDGAKVSVLPHGIDLAKFPIGDTAEKAFDLVFVGYLNRVKRVDVILNALAKLRDEGHALRLCVVGDGPLRETLEVQCETLQLKDLVTFVGHQEDISKWHLQSRIFVMASEHEGMPYALLEAMASGLVPVVTPVGGIPDWIKEDDTGMLHDGSVQQLAGKIKKLMLDEPEFSRLRQNVLSKREEVGYGPATQQWTTIFNHLN